MKLNILGLIAVGVLAGSSAFAGDKACCSAMKASNKTAKMSCEADLAKLDLNAEQKTKMNTLLEECGKAGCTKESMAKMEAGAKDVLTKEQFASWKTACKMHGEKVQS